MSSPLTDRELKRSSATLLALSLVAERARHGYEIGKLIESRSGGAISFQMASLYPLLYRLESRGWIEGRWRQDAGARRRRFYRITPAGRKVLASERGVWRVFLEALDRVAGLEKS
jgi:DNA-binding PadR family transcriptional regulator